MRATEHQNSRAADEERPRVDDPRLSTRAAIGRAVRAVAAGMFRGQPKIQRYERDGKTHLIRTRLVICERDPPFRLPVGVNAEGAITVTERGSSNGLIYVFAGVAALVMAPLVSREFSEVASSAFVMLVLLGCASLAWGLPRLLQSRIVTFEPGGEVSLELRRWPSRRRRSWSWAEVSLQQHQCTMRRAQGKRPGLKHVDALVLHAAEEPVFALACLRSDAEVDQYRRQLPLALQPLFRGRGPELHTLLH